MGIFTVTSICAVIGILLAIVGGCHDRPRLVVIGLLLMVPEAGFEARLWHIPILCTEVQVQGCIK